jgi:hypothetical protein
VQKEGDIGADFSSHFLLLICRNPEVISEHLDCHRGITAAGAEPGFTWDVFDERYPEGGIEFRLEVQQPLRGADNKVSLIPWYWWMCDCIWPLILEDKAYTTLARSDRECHFIREVKLYDDGVNGMKSGVVRQEDI